MFDMINEEEVIVDEINVCILYRGHLCGVFC